jgi:hypothetical protein
MIRAMEKRRTGFGLAFVSIAFAGAVGAADTLPTLLKAVGEAERLPTPLRADASVEIDGVEGSKRDRLVIVERSAGDSKAPRQLYLELQNAKLRLLVLGPAELELASDGKPRPAKPDETLDSTSFTAEDWLPFAAERCAAMRIADLSDQQFTLVCEPKKPPSQYSLMVYKFDREKAVMLQALLYKDTLTNLVKMMRQDDFVQVGSKWRPKRIVIQDFKLRTKDVLSLDWQVAPAVAAALFDPKTFATASLPQAAAAQKQ